MLTPILVQALPGHQQITMMPISSAFCLEPQLTRLLAVIALVDLPDVLAAQSLPALLIMTMFWMLFLVSQKKSFARTFAQQHLCVASTLGMTAPTFPPSPASSYPPAILLITPALVVFQVLQIVKDRTLTQASKDFQQDSFENK